MSKEKIILSVIALSLGLLVAGGAFYIYQMTRVINDPVGTEIAKTKVIPTPTPLNANYLIIDNPKEEEVLQKRIVTVSGKTSPGATIIISSETTDQVVKPATNGDFSLTHTLEDGVNIIHITAIFENGEEETQTKTVTFTSEEF